MSEKKVDLHADLQKCLQQLRKKRNFNAKEWIDKKTDMFNEYMRKCKLSACIVSVSGGVDSSVTIALAKEASKKKDSPIKKILGVAQPIESTEKIWKRALELQKSLEVDVITVDQTEVFRNLKKLVDTAAGVVGGGYEGGQLKSYMRTPVGFYTSQLLTQSGFPCIVLGTGNKDEDGYLFYFCKAGDGVADVQLINDLHKSEVFSVGKELGVPASILEAPPSADLWEGQTDEDELGFSYDFIELLLLYFALSEKEKEELLAQCSKEAVEQFETLKKKAEGVHNKNKHKEKYPLNLNIL